MDHSYYAKAAISVSRYAMLLLAFLLVNFKLLSQNISCNQSINLSLGDDCMATMLATDILTLDNPAGTYTLVLTSDTGAVIPANTVTSAHLWTTVTARVTNAANNSCWANVVVEDKLGPEITCSDVTVSCAGQTLNVPFAVDACSGAASVSLLSESIQTINCDPNIVQTITQSYAGTDAYGNRSTCSQTISLERIDLSLIVFPDSLLLADSTNLTCLDITDPQGTPDVSVTGVPSLNGYALYPSDDIPECNITIEFTDRMLFDFGCSRKIFRTWQVYEWVCGDLNSTNFVQVIEIGDTESPSVTCPEPISVSTSSGQCSSFVTLPLPVTSDDCTSVVEIDITYQGGFSNNATSAPVVELSGTSVVTYNVYDGCDNRTTCTMTVTVQDNASPVALCDQNTVVSLRSDGSAIAKTATFDNGSFDDCQFYRTVIKREDTSCGCDTPVFEDMILLGAHEGHYYYISQFRYSATVAANIAGGLGGELLSINTQEEDAWVTNAALEISDSVYIGLTLNNTSNTFSWPKGVAVTYAGWAAGQVDMNGMPNTSGNNVIIDANGEWNIDSGTVPRRFILEIDEPCGFSDSVTFCCEDVSDPQILVVRAIDLSGTFTECTSTVIVQDKFAPQITCPQDVTVACGSNFDPMDSAAFGLATASDQCVSDNITATISSNLNPTCGTGTIAKTFTASDDSGSNSCVQTFTVSSLSGFDPTSIDFPDDFTVDSGCGTVGLLPEDLPAANAYPIFSTGVCDNVSMSFDDQEFSFSGTQSNACSKVLRTWEVLNNCEPQVLGVNPVIHQQTITVNNVVAPTISGCEDITVGTTNCTNATLEFTISALDDCMPADAAIGTVSIDIDADGIIDNTIGPRNSISVSEVLSIGQHIAIANFSDPCGNMVSCSKRILVTDVSQANLLCKSSVSVNIQPMDLDNDPSTPLENMVRVWASALVESASNGCGGALTPAFSSTTLSDNARFFDCDFVNTVQPLEVFVITANGQVNSCVGSVVIQDNNDLCQSTVTTTGGGLSSIIGCEDQIIERDCNENGQRIQLDFNYQNNSCSSSRSTEIVTVIDFHSDGFLDINDEVVGDDNYNYNFPTPNGEHLILMSFTNECGDVTTCQKNLTVNCPDAGRNATIIGEVNTINGRGVSDVSVSLETSDISEVITDENGHYAFETMPLGGSYNIVPVKDIDFANGVNTIDLIQVQRHILGIDQLDSPYKYIAADIDRSGKIDGRDLIELRKFILGIYDDFPLNTSWRMVDANFEFDDVSNPLSQPFSSSYIVRDLKENMQIDFVGVKVGDVDNSVSLKSDKIREGRTSISMELELGERWIEAGKEYKINLSLSQPFALAGFQGSLAYDVSDIYIIDAHMQNQFSDGQIYINGKSGSLNYCWHTPTEREVEGGMLFLNLVSNKSGWLSSMITVDNSRISAEAYTDNNVVPVTLSFISGKDSAHLYHNIPNPWSESTQIKYYLPEEQPVVLSVYDVHGKLVYQEQRIGQVGENQTTVMKEDLLNTGVFYFELTTQKQRFIHKMVLVD